MQAVRNGKNKDLVLPPSRQRHGRATQPGHCWCNFKIRCGKSENLGRDAAISELRQQHNSTQNNRAYPLSLVYGQECKYPLNLLLPKAPGRKIQSYEFTRWLEEQFLEAHLIARETLGCNQERQKNRYHKEYSGESYRNGDRVWLFAPHKAKLRKFFLPWDGPYIVL